MSKAFTLVELLVTVAVVGILATMGAASFTEYRSRAYDAVAQSALHDIRNSIELRYADLGSPKGLWKYLTDNSMGYGFTRAINENHHGTNFSAYLLQSYTPNEEIVYDIQLADTGYSIQTAHCKSKPNIVTGTRRENYCECTNSCNSEGVCTGSCMCGQRDIPRYGPNQFYYSNFGPLYYDTNPLDQACNT